MVYFIGRVFCWDNYVFYTHKIVCGPSSLSTGPLPETVIQWFVRCSAKLCSEHGFDLAAFGTRTGLKAIGTTANKILL